MFASFACARQCASFAAYALAGKGIEMAAIQTSTLDQRCKNLKAERSLRLLDQIAGASREITGEMMVKGLRRWLNGR
jgi:hypothetical protein